MVKDIMCGDEAAAARSMLQITYPVRLWEAPTEIGIEGVADCVRG